GRNPARENPSGGSVLVLSPWNCSASETRCSGHVTVNAHMPKAYRRCVRRRMRNIRGSNYDQ
ncbi:hypothetical protein, partial [Mesorhizobium sp. M0323]|uniref:hypothetical protein n=1 Tax=Mesorhizobium sp. M0323 TaxID=2956938 RepID=UPI003336F514